MSMDSREITMILALYIHTTVFSCLKSEPHACFGQGGGKMQHMLWQKGKPQSIIVLSWLSECGCSYITALANEPMAGLGGNFGGIALIAFQNVESGSWWRILWHLNGCFHHELVCVPFNNRITVTISTSDAFSSTPKNFGIIIPKAVTWLPSSQSINFQQLPTRPLKETHTEATKLQTKEDRGMNKPMREVMLNTCLKRRWIWICKLRILFKWWLVTGQLRRATQS